jgi:ADP-ribose pyrophosphatase
MTSDDRETPGYRLRRRRLACENTRFEVFLDDVEATDGMVVSDYLVVAPKIRTGNLITGVAVLPVMDGKIGLLRIYRHAVQEYRWEVPRGFVDSGESDRASALRELEEETGLACVDGDLESLGYLTPEPGILAARVHLFVATRCSSIRPFSADELGHKEFRLLDPIAVASLINTSEIEDPCTLVTCLKYKD